MLKFKDYLTEISPEKKVKVIDRTLRTALSRALSGEITKSKYAKSISLASRAMKHPAVKSLLATVKEGVETKSKDFEDEVDAHDHTGEIVKPNFDELKGRIDKHIRVEARKLQQLYLDIPHDKRDDIGQEVYYSTPDNLYSLASHGQLR